ncbi:MAG: relaxase/mobilization nuclease domain-containing protein [Bacteroidaceae bacterium]|nr:relaxase/mobilization nuclease domain-containing protein [Bacteroidaceae bacterium]
MYGKILHGSGFGGLIDYANDPRKNATLVAASDGINLTNNRSITDSFLMNASLSSRTKKPVAHFVLAFSPKDAALLDDRKLERIIREYLRRMGYDDNQFVAFRHFDKEHPHVHIIVNRVNNQGRCTSDSHEKDRNVKVCKDLTKEFGLHMARGKDEVKEKRLRTMDAVRYQMMHCVRESLQVADNWKDFQEDLARVGIRCNFRFNPSTSAIEGISFTIAKDKVKNKKGESKMRHDISFSGKQLDSSLTLANLCVKLGNPVAIAHEQARDMYEDAREDWYDSHHYPEVGNIDKVFPDFDLRFPWQASQEFDKAPDIEGSGLSIAESFINDLSDKASDVADAGNGCIHAGLSAMGAILFQPYQPALSAGGGGGSSSKMGWGDDDKYKKRHSVYRSRRRGGGMGI